ncbi:MAG: CapA family protein [Actinomycetota bacterium]|nr:CapA family protein [Actinomycetota bacterium]
MWTRRSLAAGAVLLALVAGACSGDDDAASSDTTAPAPTTTVVPTTTTVPPTTTTTRGPRGSGEAVTIAFGGDTHFEGVVGQKLGNDPTGMFAAIAPALSAADLTMLNLETAITERGIPEPKTYTFRTPVSALPALAGAGVDVVSMANNHGMDFGAEGLEDSLVAKETSGFPIVGIGRTAADAYAPYRVDIKGQRTAIIGATQVLDASLESRWTATDTQAGLASAKHVERLVAAVVEARPTSDTVIVFLHWGIEEQTCPSGAQTDLARRLADAGADVIVGGHAHRRQGAGRLGNAFVAYGLGNFIWYSPGGPGAQTGILTVTVTGREIDSYTWQPAVIRDGIPGLLDGQAATDALAEWEGLRGCTGLTP